MQIIKIETIDNHDLNDILASGLEDGFRFVQRLMDEYKNETNTFDKEGEALFLLEVDNQIVGVGGINIDPYLNDASIGRIRHVYILPKYRGIGFGTQLLIELIEEAKKKFMSVRLLTNNPIADKLYEKVGFIRVEEEYKASHVLDLCKPHVLSNRPRYSLINKRRTTMDHKNLIPITKLLERNNITYALGGSGLLYYLNLIDSVNDWDITVECSKDTLIKAINEYAWEEHRSGDYPFASQYRLSLVSHNIDFIGNFSFYSEDVILTLPVSIYGDWDGINLSSLEIWYIAYFLMNRTEKANLILSYLKDNKEKVNETLIRDLLKKDNLNNHLSDELSMLIK